MSKDNKKKVIITLKKSVIGVLPKHKATVKALGLGKINSKVVHVANSAINGMINSVKHLIDVEESN